MCLCMRFTYHQNSVRMRMQRVNRGLLLEPAESPINPSFIHMSSPIPDGCESLFYLPPLQPFFFFSFPKNFSGAYKQCECEASDPRIAPH